MIWGASAVNVFNYTYMQEYVAAILGLELGTYYHIADNFHYYERHDFMVRQLAKIHDVEDTPIVCKKTFSTLAEFDNLVTALGKEEYAMRTNPDYERTYFEDPFFENWYNELFLFNTNGYDKE